MKNYEVILWDVDGTLLDFLRSERYALIESFLFYNIQIREEVVELYSKINSSFWMRFERDEIKKEEVLYGRFDALFKHLKEDGRLLNAYERPYVSKIDPVEFQIRYQGYLSSVYYFLDDAYTLCQKLSKDFRQYIVTNGVARTQIYKLENSYLINIMDDIFISEELGKPKPHKEFFDACFLRISDFDKDKTIIIGDSLTSDILGGNNAGISTCWYNPKKYTNDTKAVADFEIKNLWEVENILWQKG